MLFFVPNDFVVRIYFLIIINRIILCISLKQYIIFVCVIKIKKVTTMFLFSINLLSYKNVITI